MAVLRHRSRRDKVLSSTFALAVSLCAGAVIVRAQSFQGTPSVVVGSATIAAGATTTDVTLLSNNAVIDWAPNDIATGGGPIAFQAAGTTATFQADGATFPNFTVLNRILPADPTRQIGLDGTILGQLLSATGAPSTGGTIFFYSPGGFLIGPNAAINVGNLGLTASDVAYNAAGDFGGANGTVTFLGATQSGAQITTSAGSSITTPNPGSYVAMFAPSIVHNGTVTVNGSAALVAGEAGTITFSPNGLFDIQVTTGTDGDASNVAIDNTGTITGPAGNGFTQSHRVYMVAVPKNTAISMLIAGDSKLGFDVAAAADTVGNAVVLSAGGDVFFGSAFGPSSVTSGAAVNIDDNGGTVDLTSQVNVGASDFNLTSSGTTNLAAGLTVYAYNSASATANGGSLSVGGDVYLSTSDFLTIPGATDDGGIASLGASNGGAIDITGSAYVLADGENDRNLDGNLTGGTATAGATGTNSLLTIGGALNVSAQASGVEGSTGPSIGGQASLYATSGGTVSVTGQAAVASDGITDGTFAATGGTASAYAQDGGSLSLSALAVTSTGQSSSYQGIGAAGEAGTGGTASLYAAGTASTIDITGGAAIDASGSGADGSCVTCTIDGGTGTGGLAQVYTVGSGHTLTIAALGLDASGTGGAGIGGAGGAGVGGTMSVSIGGNSTLNLTSSLVGTATGVGGSQSAALAAGDGTGGQATIDVLAGSTLTSSFDVQLSAYGAGGSSIASGTGGDGGVGQGGTAELTSAGATTLTNGSYTFDATGIGGDGLNGGMGTGGVAGMNASGGTLDATAGIVNGAPGAISASALGIGGGANFAGGSTGSAQGGQATFSAGNGGAMTVTGSVALDSTAYAGLANATGVDGGDATGGTAQLSESGSGALSIIGDATLHAIGFGGANSGGGDLVSGNGTGGSALVTSIGSGGLTISGGTGVALFADGYGGTANSQTGPASGGAGQGGTANIVASSGPASVGDSIVSAIGFGGAGIGGGAGGAGAGGSANVMAISSLSGPGSLTVGALTVAVGGTGGDGGAGLAVGQAGGAGGAGTGGVSVVDGAAGNGALNIATVAVSALGVGGNGGAGYSGSGATGGDGGLGGVGTGGSIQAGTESGIATSGNTGSAMFGTVQLAASGLGGAGGAAGTGASTTGIGGGGGTGNGGAALLLVSGSPVNVTGNVTMDASGTGGASSAGTPGGATIARSGGAGLVSGVGLTVTNRTGQPAQRGTLTVGGAIAGTAIALDGNGARSISTSMGSQPIYVIFNNGDATVTGGLTFAAAANQVIAGASASLVDLLGATADFGTDFAFTTPGDVTVGLDGSTLTADVIDISGNDWLLGAMPASPGSLVANTSLALGTTNNLLTYAGLTTSFPVALTVPGSLQLGDLSIGGFFTADSLGGPMTLGNLDVTNATLTSANGITTQAINATGFASLAAGGLVSTGALTIGRYVDIQTTGSIDVGGDVQSGAQVGLNANGSITAGNISSGIVNPSITAGDTYSIALQAGGTLSAGNIQAAQDIGVGAPQAISLGALDGRDMLLLGLSTFTSGPITASGNVLIANLNMAALGQTPGGFDPAPVFAATPVPIPGSITINGDTSTGGFFHAATQQDFTSGAISAGGDLLLTVGGLLSSGLLSSGGALAVNAGSAQLGDVNSSGSLSVVTSGALTAGNLTGASGVQLTSGGALATGAVVAPGGAVQLTSGGTLGTGAVTATSGAASLTSSGALSVNGDLAAGLAITLSSGTSLSAGNLGAGSDISATAGTTATFGALTAGNGINLVAGGAVTIASSTSPVFAGAASSAMTFTATTQGDFSSGAIGASGGITVDAGGNATIGSIDSGTGDTTLTSGGATSVQGPVTAGSFSANALGDFSAPDITATSAIYVQTGGLASVGGIWSAPQISVTSADIDIPASNPVTGGAVGLDAGITGTITLTSTNPAGMFIGDGLNPGSGYALDGSEWSRIQSGSVNIRGIDTSFATDMSIGDLVITGPQAGSTIDDPTGFVAFATGNLSTLQPSGTIRIVGNVAAQGFLPGNALLFDAQTFELDAASGSLIVTDSSGALSGIVAISADHIHIAQASILDKLRADPFYAGRFTDLNSPAAIQRPGGVFNALAFELYPGSTLYIQNTGTAAVPAGFFTSYSTSDITPPQVPPAGGISVIINGQFDTPVGVVTGSEAFNMLISDPRADFTGIAANSTFNTCSLSLRVCVGATTGVLPTISTEINLFSQDPLGLEPFSNVFNMQDIVSIRDLLTSPDILSLQDILFQDGLVAGLRGPPGPQNRPGPANPGQQQGGAGGSGPALRSAGIRAKGSIGAPKPLMDAKALVPPAIVTEPVAGSGNPALIGSGTGKGSTQGGDQ